MTEPAGRIAPAREAGEWRDAAAAFFIFAVLGPPAGAFLTGAGIHLIDKLAQTPFDVSGFFSGALLMGLMAMTMGAMFAFLIGGLQAVLVGLVVAAMVRLMGRPPLWMVLAAAALVGAAALVPLRTKPAYGALFFSSDVFAAFMCWLILRSAVAYRKG